MAIKITKDDVKWGYLGTLMSIGVNILLLPMVLLFLTGNELGLWYVFLSLGSIVFLLDFGFTPTLARNIAYCWSGANDLAKEDVYYTKNRSAPNIPLMKTVMKTCRVIYLIIALVALVLLLTAGTFYIKYISSEMNGMFHIVAWYIFCIAVYLNLYYSYYTSFLKGVGAISENGKAIVMSKLIQILLSLFLLLLGFGILAVSIAYLLSGFAYRFLSKKYFYNYEEIGTLIKNETVQIKANEIKRTFLIIYHNAWRDGLVSISNYLVSQANILLCSLFLSLAETGIFALSLQLIQTLTKVSVSFYGTYQPVLQEAHLINDKENSKKIMSTAITVYTLIFWIGCSGLILIGTPLLNFMNQGGNIDKGVLLFMSLYMFLYQNNSLFASYISNTNKIPYVKAFLVSGIIMVLLSVLLLKYTPLGIWALMLSQAFVQLCYNNWKWPSVVMRDLHTTPLEMIKVGFSIIASRVKQHRTFILTTKK